MQGDGKRLQGKSLGCWRVHRVVCSWDVQGMRDQLMSWFVQRPRRAGYIVNNRTFWKILDGSVM